MFLCGSPDHWVVRQSSRECAAQIGEKHERLGHDSVIIKPVEAGTEVRATSERFEDGGYQKIDL